MRHDGFIIRKRIALRPFDAPSSKLRVREGFLQADTASATTFSLSERSLAVMKTTGT
jgi:hypothetical protein